MSESNRVRVVHESHVMVDLYLTEECTNCALCICHSDLTMECVKTEPIKDVKHGR